MPDDLLNPIPGENPGGADLRYEPIYDKIKEARHEDADVPAEDWEKPRKLADWPVVIKLASDALATKTKDLQIAAWLTEALLRRDGFGGLATGLTLLRELEERFWDHLHPLPDEGDLEVRAAPLEWVGTRLDLPVKSVPINKTGHSYLQYKESRAISSEKEAEQNQAKGTARQEALADGKVPPEVFDKGFEGTPKAWYRQLAGDLDGCRKSLDTLDQLSAQKFGDVAPNLIPLREVLEEVWRAVQALLARKLQLDPDPVPVGGAEARGGSEAAAGGAAGGLPAEPVSAADAAARVVAAARFLRGADAANPASYLILRALRWGEVRAGGSEVDPRLLDAPTSQDRTRLKTLLLDQDWQGLLEAAETVMGTSAGRGWLDLQRYTLNALAGLGPELEIAARAVRLELRGLLAEVPGLPSMTLMDDLPTAGPKTLEWLRTEGLTGEAPAEGGEAEPAQLRAPAARQPASGPDRLFDRALTEVRAGRAQKGIELLKRELDRETSTRGRFIRQAQLARVMVEAGLEPVAAPMLQELLGLIETHKLEDWEAGSVVAEPMALLYRVLDKLNGDPAVKESLYLRICRLDPVQAMGFGQSVSGQGASDASGESDGAGGA
jgi:type VI secretion system protein ImpA